MRTNAYLNESNDILSIVINLSQYFFDVRFSLKEVTKQNVFTIIHSASKEHTSAKKQRSLISNQEDVNMQEEDEEDGEESEEEKKSFNLKMLY